MKTFIESMTPPRAMLRVCRQRLFDWKIADSTGDSLSGGQLLMRALILARLLRREVLANDEKYVGVLIPPSNGAMVVNAALALSRRVVVNVNYSATSEVVNACLKSAGVRHVLTSQRVLDKLNLKLDAELVLLESLKEKLTLADKLTSALLAYAFPAWLTERLIGLASSSPDDEVTVIFTSGSTGEPKGVVLTNGNVTSNIYGMYKVVRLNREDIILGILPFFHSFGYTITLWGPLAIDLQAAYHFSPLDARQVGKLAGERKATIILATPTFLRSYLKRCDKEDFASIQVVVAGAEKLPVALSDAFEEKFGVRPIEGYGATELSPLVSVNVPAGRSTGKKIDSREGSVGQPIPDVEARIVDPDTWQTLPTGEDGMLLIRGPNLMKGYLNDPEKTAKVVRDGWYVTGDVARLDAEGFIHITGRESRFSKIGGEMVPHVLIEETIHEFLSGGKDADPIAVVTAVPDERKGERLVVVHLPLPKTPAEISKHLAGKGMPNLWIPGEDCYLQVEELPLLGSGKLDLKGLAALAKERFL